NQQVNVVIEERYNNIADEVLMLLNKKRQYMVFEIHESLSKKIKLDMRELITTLEKMAELKLITSNSIRIDIFSIIKRI
ncbi:hypothetical protein ACFYLN_17040, partial [Proteus mirabilis]